MKVGQREGRHRGESGCGEGERETEGFSCSVFECIRERDSSFNISHSMKSGLRL